MTQEQLIRELIERKRAARKGSTEHAFIVRQLQGLGRTDEGAGLIGYYDHDASEYLYRDLLSPLVGTGAAPE
jgi:hypothetical protein